MHARVPSRSERERKAAKVRGPTSHSPGSSPEAPRASSPRASSPRSLGSPKFQSGRRGLLLRRKSVHHGDGSVPDHISAQLTKKQSSKQKLPHLKVRVLAHAEGALL